MYKDFPEFVTSEACLQCDGCCRFSDDKSVWRPKVGKEELTDSIRNDIGEEFCLRTIDKNNQAQCVFFRETNNKCSIYPNRPFDCRLYPFVLLKEKNRRFLSVHKMCPYVSSKHNSEEFKKAVCEIKKYMNGKSIKIFVSQNRHLFGEYVNYRNELEVLFEIE